LLRSTGDEIFSAARTVGLKTLPSLQAQKSFIDVCLHLYEAYYAAASKLSILGIPPNSKSYGRFLHVGFRATHIVHKQGDYYEKTNFFKE